jgi:hypothetical protein
MSDVDLIVLAADKDIEFGLRGILSRHEALSIRPVRYDVFVHPEHDPGCLLRSHLLLRAFHRRYRHAMVVFDLRGAGRERASRQELETEVEKQLAADWDDRAAAVVIDPEVEAWVWSDSPHVARVLGWEGRRPNLREWLEESGFTQPGEAKPPRPKESMRAALREVGKPPSSALFEMLAQSVSLARCTDGSFAKLLAVLRTWFPVTW